MTYERETERDVPIKSFLIIIIQLEKKKQAYKLKPRLELDLYGKRGNTDDRRMIKEERNLTATCATSLHGGRGRHHRRRWEARGAPAETLGELRCLAMAAAAAVVVVSSRAPPEALMKALTILHPSLSLCSHYAHLQQKDPKPLINGKTAFCLRPLSLSLYIVGTKRKP